MDSRAHDHLQACFQEAASMGLDPSWHDDERGFDYDCPTCIDEPHRCRYRLSNRPSLLFFGPARATGPAG